jgi:hypothetical protein
MIEEDEETIIVLMRPLLKNDDVKNDGIVDHLLA